MFPKYVSNSWREGAIEFQTHFCSENPIVYSFSFKQYYVRNLMIFHPFKVLFRLYSLKAKSAGSV